METVTLLPGAVTLRDPVFPGSTVVGDPPQWADDTDATYSIVDSDPPPGVTGVQVVEAPLPSLPGTTGRVTIVTRIAASVAGSDTAVLVRIDTQGHALAPFSIPADGVIREIAADVDPAISGMYPGWLADGPAVVSARFNGNYTDRTFTIYELRVLVEVDSLPVTRLHPRDDGRGLSSAPRIHPPPKARRIVGGYQ